MATIKSYTDLEQSRKLAEILPIETADMNWHELPSIGLFVRAFPYKHDNGATEGIFPCWSLAALLDVIPDSIYDNTNEFSQLEFSKRSIAYRDLNDGIKIGSLKDNLVDACYEMIIRLNELKML